MPGNDKRYYHANSRKSFLISLSFLQTNKYFRILSRLNDLREKAGEAISAVAN